MNTRLNLPLLVVLLGSCASLSFGQAMDTLEDIEFWVGSGTNRAALAIDWDGEASEDQAFVWGYRWDETASGTDMLDDVIKADPRLYAKLSRVAGLGTAVIGLGYDLNDDGQFELTDNTAFDEHGINLSGLDDGETSLDTADFYAEGWFLGFWHIGFASENPFAGAAFSSTLFGTDSLTLTDESWLSLAFTPDTLSTTAFAENPIAAETPYSADFDQDNDIDGADFLTWQLGFGVLENALPEQGDANGDRRVDGLDLQIWSATFGEPNALGVGSAVPEPTCFMFVVGPLFILLGESRTLRRSI